MVRTFALLVTILAAAIFAPASEGPINFALSEKLFWHNKPEDVLPQAQLVCNEIGKRINRTLSVEAGVESIVDIRDSLTSGAVQFVFSDGLDFVRLRTGQIAPGAVAPPLKVRAIATVVSPPDERSADIGCTRATVMAKNDPGIRSFADLKGKRFVYSRRTEMDFSMLFLEELIRKQGFAKKEDFFGSVKRLSCDDACLICLERGSADATCLPEVVLLAKELVAGKTLRDLKRLEASDPYANYLCFYLEGKVEEGVAARIQQELLTLHERPEGAKLLQIFHVSRCGPVRDNATVVIEQILQPAQHAGGKPVPADRGAGS